MFSHFAYRAAFGPRAVMIASGLALAAFTVLAFVAKDAAMAVYSTFTTMDPYDANDTLPFSAAKSLYQGLFGFNKDTKLVNVLCDSYEVSKDGLAYMFELHKDVRSHDGTTFDANAVKANLDRVTDPVNKPKRFVLFNHVVKTEVVDPYTARVTLKESFSPFINMLVHPSVAMISPTVLKKYGKDIMFHPVDIGPFESVEWKQTDYLKGRKFGGHWKYDLPKIDAITWKPVVDNNMRATIMQTGKAGFAFTIPLEQAAVLKSSPKVGLVVAPSIIQRYVSSNTNAKSFDNPKVRQAINYAISKDTLTKVVFVSYAVPSEDVMSPGVDYAAKLGSWPYNPVKAKEPLKEAGYPNGFETQLWSAYNHTTTQKIIQFVQQQLTQIGTKAPVPVLEAGQCIERVESVPKPEDVGVRTHYVGWSSLTGKSNWALRPLLTSEVIPPKSSDTAYYKNGQVDANIVGALRTTDRAEKLKLYTGAQKRIWEDAPWAFLVTEKIVYARPKRLPGVYVAPDGLLGFRDVDIKQ